MYKWKTNSNMVDLKTIITENVNGFKILIEKQNLSEWIKNKTQL